MKSLLKTMSLVALSGVVALSARAGDDQKDLKKVIEDQGINYVETAQKGITLSGYVDTSYTYQFAGRGEYAANIGDPSGNTTIPNPGTGPANSHAALRQFDTSNNTFNINAVKIAIEKALPDKNDWAAGFRIDTIYGEDARYLGDSALNGGQFSFDGGLNNSGLALEQAFVKFRVPVGNGLDIYMGKFVTFLGYEVIESPANLNFSRGLLFTNLIPLTHTGIYADYKFNDMIEAKFGIVDGWNNSTSSSVGSALGGSTGGSASSSSFGKALTGQLTINAPGKNANITQSFIYSPEGEPGVVGQNNGPLAVYDIWGNWSPTFVKDSALLLGFNIDLGYNGASGTPGGYSFPSGNTHSVGSRNVNDSNTFWGAALYSQYKFNKVFSLAGRLEYIHSDAAIFPKFGPTGASSFFGASDVPAQNDYSATLTASFNIWDNLLTRIEYRLDDICGATNGGYGGPGGDTFVSGKTSVQHEISLNAVYSF